MNAQTESPIGLINSLAQIIRRTPAKQKKQTPKNLGEVRVIGIFSKKTLRTVLINTQ